jgi:lipid II isoglutaminyl synthase (glutamine-hydrolysing)
MSSMLTARLAIAKGAAALTRLAGGGATSAPGRVLLRLDPDAISHLAARLRYGNVLISATNGKTTTAAMLAGILAEQGVPIVHNQAGANMAGGIASTLLEAAHPRRGIDGELGVFEVDEFWLAGLIDQLHPRGILLANLFRDQLDRYGELESIADRWRQAVHSGPARQAKLVLGADDPMVADLGFEREQNVLYFGVQDDAVAREGLSHAADARHCRRCGAPYVFRVVYMGHLGDYRCPSCGHARPQPQVWAGEVLLAGVEAAHFTLHTPAGSAQVSLPLPGLYNVYNALGAAALARSLEIPLECIVAGLQRTRAAFGRAETVTLQLRPSAEPASREMRIMLVKNPTGANEVLRTLALQPGEHDLLGVLNDNTADGRDVSWIWDADFELLAGRLRRATCSGTRAPELALRLRYAGIEPQRISVQEDLAAALRLAAADRPDERADAPLYALPTYTAMLALRKLLLARGEAQGRWSS